MSIMVDRDQCPPPGESEIIALMRAEGLAPHVGGNAPGDTYGWHEHSYEKALYCVRGQIVFQPAAAMPISVRGPAGASAVHPARGYRRRRGGPLR